MKSQNSILQSESERNSLNRRIVTIFWLIAVFMGAIHAWDTRHVMNADGISYLDIGDAYMRGDWKTAINANWSPLYSWLLGLAMLIVKPSPYYEFTVVHAVNFVIYLFTIGSFHFFLVHLIRSLTDNRAEVSHIVLSEWALISLGYALFIQASLNMITLSSVTPDMCMAAFLYLAIGTLLRIRGGATNYISYAVLGVILGFGYLAKAVMFPLAFIFLTLSVFAGDKIRRAFPRAILAFIIFLLIAAPFIAAISNAKGHFTYGESGKYNYWWHVNAKHIYHWTGTPAGTGVPVHPTRQISDVPAIY